jgi:P-type Cu2+ transporter
VSSAATFDPTGPWGAEVWFDSLTMFVFFLLGGRYLEFKARDRTAGALDSLMNRLPEVCERETAKGFETVSIRRLVAGDVVRLQAGQAFPADGELLSELATVDEALLTGESRPVSRTRGQLQPGWSRAHAGDAGGARHALCPDRQADGAGLHRKAAPGHPG